MSILSSYIFGLKLNTAITTIPLANIISEYKFENNANDTVGINNGTATSIAYVSGLVGLQGSFNGSASVINIPDNANLSFTDGAGNDQPFSISLLAKFNNPTTSNGFLVCKMSPTGTLREWGIRYNGTTKTLMVQKYNNLTNNYLSSEYIFPTAPLSTEYVHIICTNINNDKMKIYINGNSLTTTSTETVPYVGMGNGSGDVQLGKYPASTTLTHNGYLDCIRFWDKQLTSRECLKIAQDELVGIDINP